MALGIILKNVRKAGAFVGGELAAGQIGVDVANDQLYFSSDGSDIVGPIGAAGAAATLATLADVLVASMADNDVLAFDTTAGKWLNQTAAQAGLLATALRGAANGVAGLDGGGKVPIAQLPDTVVGAVEYQGTWNANTNSPDLPASSPSKGDYYVVSTAGATSLGGITDWKVGDWAIYNGAAWQKVDNTDQVTSVFGRAGTVTAAAGDYAASQITNDSGVAGATSAAALDTLNTGKAAASHTHNASDINAGNLVTARMQTNVAAALNASGIATITNSSLTLDGGTL